MKVDNDRFDDGVFFQGAYLGIDSEDDSTVSMIVLPPFNHWNILSYSLPSVPTEKPSISKVKIHAQ